MQQRKLAVSHAGGVLAEAVLECMKTHELPAEELVLLDSEDRRGSRIAYGDTYLVTDNQQNFDYSSCSLLLLMEPDPVVEDLARSEGCFILGCNSDENLPAVFYGSSIREPEISYGADSARLPSSESCCVLDALICLNRIQPVQQVHLTWLQSASQQGKAGIDELASQTVNLLNTREIKPLVFPEQIAFNLFSSASETRVETELSSYLALPPGNIMQNTIVAPIFYGLAVSVVVDFSSAVDVESLSQALGQLDGIEVRQQGGSVVSDCNQSFSCLVSQIQASGSDSHRVSFWLMADPYRYGLARNYVSVSGFLQNSFL